MSKEKEITTRLKKTTAGYGYKYTDLAEIHEYLESAGYTYYQEIERHDFDGEEYIVTTPILKGEELPKRKGCKVPSGALLSKANAAQEYGSALTYARRYSLLMAFGLATEDDDAEKLTKPKSIERKPTPAKPAPLATEEQKTIIKEKYNEEEIGKILKDNKLVNIDLLTVAQASALIERRKNE